MKSIKKKFLLVTIIMVIWMLFSTKIICFIYNRNVTIQSIKELPNNEQSSIYYWINDFMISENIWDTVSISGWLTNQPEHDNCEKDVYILFKSEHKIYKIRTGLYHNPAVVTAIRKKGLNVENLNTNFGVTFSPLFFEDGTYQMYIYCESGVEQQGIVATNRFIKKDKKGVSVFDMLSSQISYPLILTQENSAMGFGWIDSIKRSGNILSISGWGYLDGMDSTNQKVVIEIIDQDGEKGFYEAYPYTRTDLVGKRNNMKQQNSGISANIDIGDMDISLEDIKIYVINENKWFVFNPTVDIQQVE